MRPDLIIAPSEQLRKWARRVPFGSSGWLRILDELGILGPWLAEEEPNRTLALRLLHRWGHAEPERVAALLQPWVTKGDDWHRRIWAVVGHQEAVLRNERGWALIRSLMAISEPGPHAYLASIKFVPERCCEALAIRLRRIVATTPASLAHGGGHDLRIPYKAAAEASPAAFLDHLGPVVLDLPSRVPSRWGRDGLPRRDGFFWEGVYKLARVPSCRGDGTGTRTRR